MEIKVTIGDATFTVPLTSEADAISFMANYAASQRATAASPKSGDEQSQHQAGRILLAAGAPVIDVEMLRRDLLHRIQNEVDDVIGGHPLAQIARQEHRSLAVDIDQTGWHRILIPITSPLFKILATFFPS